jgi:hypothetical protein
MRWEKFHRTKIPLYHEFIAGLTSEVCFILFFHPPPLFGGFYPSCKTEPLPQVNDGGIVAALYGG